MMDFCLSGLTPSFLEKVITKLDEKSYFHLQQTCHDMYDFIRRSQNISIHLNGLFDPVTGKCDEISGRYWLDIAKDWSKNGIRASYARGDAFGTLKFVGDELVEDLSNYYECKIDLADLYGTRLPDIRIDSDVEDIDGVLDCLKKHRVTCVELGGLFQPTDNWTDEQILAFWKVVKPRNASLGSRYDLFFQSKTIEHVQFQAKSGDVLALVKRFLPVFPEMTVSSTCYTESAFNLYRAILEYLHSTPLPNLRHFELSYIGEGRADVEIEDLEEVELAGYNLTVIEDSFDHLVVNVEMPTHFPPGTVCRLGLKSDIFGCLQCGNIYDYDNEKENKDEDEKDGEEKNAAGDA